ncbi:MAG: U32 family peptidase [Roseburia sp.]|nr:U32 family peptidase [Roseburia sp.]MCM1279719.1 U32 family peptidase [Robinsoniella sp.]
MKKQVELLAPAGSLPCFYAAMNAGADAVYLGGDKFGARAYADNFNTEELLEAIGYAHLFHKKVYLTMNTLLKDEELLKAVDYVKPFYEAGLDGVIIQDLGVLSLLKKQFPGLELHASTQMTITGKEGALLLKKYGVCRIVPARELSLEEIKEIKNQVDIELEVFIHGAMCYAYSGQCLFSSMLGGRSGNRGRCAGPCRLPYDAFYKGKQINSQKEQYLLSLKDLCAISLLPELLEAGIDSFKIEGRMKSPEYVAGVTSIYRKYIDRYYQNRQNAGNVKKAFQIEEKDMELLKKLYVRSDLESGYFEKQNGASMVTLLKPCYQTGDKKELEEITSSFLKEPDRFPIEGHILLKEGQPAELLVNAETENVKRENTKTENTKTENAEKGISVSVKGNIVQTASNRPVDEEAVRKQIQKTGGTPFVFKSLKVLIEGSCFVSVKELNDLRRQALKELSLKLAEPFRRSSREIMAQAGETEGKQEKRKNGCREGYPAEAYHIVVSNYEQLEAVTDFLKEQDRDEGKERLQIQKLSVSSDLFRMEKNMLPFLKQFLEMGIELSVAFPRIVRKNTLKNLKEHILNKQEMGLFSSFLIGSLELLEYLKENHPDKVLYGDYSLYCFNREAYGFLKEQGLFGICMPYEWSRHEMADMLRKEPDFTGECIVYSYIPLMESAGCILKTTGNGSYCREKENMVFLKDRYKKKLPILVHCDRCENTIYNSVPYSLHKEIEGLKEMGISRFRMDFTVETKEQTIERLQYFRKKEKRQQPFYEFTKGHFAKGVE